MHISITEWFIVGHLSDALWNLQDGIIRFLTITKWHFFQRASGRKEKDAKLRYLSLISQFPLYGCVKFFAHYKGIWAYGPDFLLAVNHTDIKFISIQQKTIICTYHYAQIESLTIDFDKSLLQILLSPTSVAEQFSYLFECLSIDDMAKLLEAYAPNLITWKQSDVTVRNKVRSSKLDTHLDECLQW